MKSAIKLCSITQRLLVLVSGILLAFMLSVHDRTPYQDALSAILLLGEDGARDMSTFITSKWIVERRSDEEILPIYQASNRTLRRFSGVLLNAMDDLGAMVDHEKVFSNTIFTDFDNQVRLGGWERPDLFLPLPPVGNPTVRRMLHYIERDRLRGTILVLPSYDIWFTPHISRVLKQRSIDLNGMTLIEVKLLSDNLGKGRIEPISKEPGSEMPRGLFHFTFENKLSPSKPFVEFDVEVPMNRTSYLIEGEEWLELRRNWYKSLGLEPEHYESISAPFEKLRILESEIGNMKLTEAADWLRQKASRKADAIDLIGISLQDNLVSVFGPIVLSILMIGIISAIYHVLSISDVSQLTSDDDVYWGVVSPSRIARVTSFVAISLLPGGTCIAMAVYLGGNVTVLTLNISGTLIAMCVFWSASRLVSNVTLNGGSETS